MILSYVCIVLYDNNFRPFVVIWKPFQIILNYVRTNWDVRTSTIDVFATFFFLSNFKYLTISFDLLTPVKVYQLHSDGNLTYRWGLFYDATIPYFRSRHLPYAIIAIATLLLFTLLPVLLLILYPFRCFQKLLNLFPFRWYILHTFVDAFHGCYKDGTEEGTRDYRWFASLFFLMRFVFFFDCSLYSDSELVCPQLNGMYLGAYITRYNSAVQGKEAALFNHQCWLSALNKENDCYITKKMRCPLSIYTRHRVRGDGRCFRLWEDRVLTI